MSVRLPVALISGTGTTFLLFWAMSALVATDGGLPGTRSAPSLVEFIRVKPESETRRKERRIPEKLARAEPPSPPALRTPRASRPTLGSVDASVTPMPIGDLADIPRPGLTLSDMDIVPLVRIAPQYPARAARSRIAGWVLMEFTVSATGGVEDVRVVDSDPPRTFDRAALQAVKKFKYRPRIEDGRPVARPGVQLLLRFDPNQAAQ